jgi:hypothetical protein
MEYDSRSPESILAFDISFEFYRAKNDDELYFMEKKDAHMCGIISLNQIIEQLNNLGVDEEKIIIYHRAKEILTYLINENEK